VIDPRRIGLVRSPQVEAQYHLQPHPRTGHHLSRTEQTLGTHRTPVDNPGSAAASWPISVRPHHYAGFRGAGGRLRAASSPRKSAEARSAAISGTATTVDLRTVRRSEWPL
jgi:hypothetical protein